MARRLNFAPREIKRQDNRESPGESCDNMNNTQVKEISAGAPLDAGPVEVLRIPFLSTGNRTIDKAFSIACGDLAGNIGLYRAGLLESKVPVIRAGLQYPTPWTRDASFNSWYAGAVIAPEIARNTLLAALARRDGELRIDEEYGQYWDTIIWAWGAWNYWLCSGDTEFLLTALPATENTLRFFRRTEFDPEDGLFRGGACFQDGISAYPDRFVSDDCGSGILDCLHDCPKHDWLVKVGCGIPCKALSTNCLYLLACQSAANMRRVLHLPVPPELERETAALKQAIDRSFWREDAGCFRYLIDAGDTVERQEGLGIAFAILAGVVSAPRLSRLIANTHLTPNGIAAVWPQYERYASAPGVYARHSGTIWPQVNAAWCQALAESGFREQALRETELLAAKAVRDSMFYEIYHPDTGLPYGGMQEKGRENGIVEWQSCSRQSWSATGFLRMVFASIWGMQWKPDSLQVSPIPPENGEMTLQNLLYRGTRLNLKAIRGGTPGMLVNGVPAEKITPAPGTTLEIVIHTP